MELKYDIHQFEGTRGINCYWTIFRDSVVIIDTSNPKNEKKILDQLKTTGKQPEDVKFIIITHADIDHVGSAAALKQITEAKIAIHEADAAIVRKEAPFKKGSGFLGIIYNIMMKFIRFTQFEPDILLKDGDEIAGFRVLHMPGHTNGSIMFYKTDQILITGDTLLSNRKEQPLGPIKAFTPHMQQAWHSIRKLADLHFDMMLPGHGKVLQENASEKVRHLIEKHQS